MTNQFSHLCALAALSFAMLAGCAAVKPAAEAPLVPATQSVADADRKLAVVAQQRAAAEAAYAAAEQVCNARFLVNRCMDGAREKRRSALANLRAIEIEAERFKRQAKVDERDRALARGEEEYRANEAKLAAQPPAPPRQEAAPKVPPTPPRNTPASHAAKMKKLEAQDKADAGKRAANVEAYEKRKRDSEERQRKVEEKKKAKISEAEDKK